MSGMLVGLLAHSTVNGWVSTEELRVNGVDQAVKHLQHIQDGIAESILDYRHRIAMFVEPGDHVCICRCQQPSSL
ncbi:hypothetical protein BJV82DRAFT_622836 [Fennellomyces sp. T-0311]|nr:hypothetical protein BJV82DRAFT_622836 [Fennellomyces sp. T-0311]